MNNSPGKEMGDKSRVNPISNPIREGDEIGDYIVFGFSRASAERMQRNDKDSIQPLFLVRDAIYMQENDDRVLKYSNPTYPNLKTDLEKILRHEANITAKLDHPNIVKSYPAFRRKNTLFAAFEYLPYQVHEIISRKPNIEGIIFFALESAKALQYMKQEGVVHGDIKVSHFMGTTDPEDMRYSSIKLIDFAGATHPAIKKKCLRSYTPSYAAPEILAARQEKHNVPTEKELKKYEKVFSHKSDIYSLGLCYARVALTGIMKPDDLSGLFREPGKTAKKAIESAYNNNLPYMFNRIIEDMTREDPDERIDADHLIRRLNEFSRMFNLHPKIIPQIDLMTGRTIGNGLIRKY